MSDDKKTVYRWGVTIEFQGATRFLPVDATDHWQDDTHFYWSKDGQRFLVLRKLDVMVITLLGEWQSFAEAAGQAIEDFVKLLENDPSVTQPALFDTGGITTAQEVETLTELEDEQHCPDNPVGDQKHKWAMGQCQLCLVHHPDRVALEEQLAEDRANDEADEADLR